MRKFFIKRPLKGHKFDEENDDDDWTRLTGRIYD